MFPTAELPPDIPSPAQREGITARFSDLISAIESHQS
ncbi:hypothetical protein FVEN_g12814 [Fusarium venenatum]|nr:hypothetical protein FVEN_g12814 [Fusarium venenatum]